MEGLFASLDAALGDVDLMTGAPASSVVVSGDAQSLAGQFAVSSVALSPADAEGVTLAPVKPSVADASQEAKKDDEPKAVVTDGASVTPAKEKEQEKTSKPDEENVVVASSSASRGDAVVAATASAAPTEKFSLEAIEAVTVRPALVEMIHMRSDDYEATQAASAPPLVPADVVHSIQRHWAESDTWLQSAMQHDEWASLSPLVLDRIFRENMHFLDIRSMALTCKKWSAAALTKVPFTVAIFAENKRKKEEYRAAELQKLREKRAARMRELRQGFTVFSLISICTVSASVIGVIPTAYFPYLFASVSIVPDCDSAYSLRASLYCCCAFWLFDAFLFFLWSLSAFSPPAWNRPVGDIWSKFSLEFVFALCNTVGVLSNVGIWSSAAACIYFCNTCIDLNPFVAYQVRAFAAFSVALGVTINVIGLRFEYEFLPQVRA